MLHLFNKQILIGSPVNGKVVDLNEVNDPVFSGRTLGDGCAVIPQGNRICSPCNGKIVQIIDTNHAFCILSDDGLEILVHIGLDTVKLKGTGFKRLKEEGMPVKMGEPVMEVDLSYLREQKKEIITPIVITNMEKVSSLKIAKGTTDSSGTIMKVKLK